MQLLALLGTLALLVCNAAAGLASRLAGGLALATTAVLSTFAQIASLDGLDMFHNFTFQIKFCILSLPQCVFGVNYIFYAGPAVLPGRYSPRRQVQSPAELSPLPLWIGLTRPR
jgi:hypothetical protein